MISIGEWRELQIPGDKRVGHSSAIPHHVDDLGVGEGSGQEARLGQLEWFLAADDVSWLSMPGYHLQYECRHSLQNISQLTHNVEMHLVYNFFVDARSLISFLEMFEVVPLIPEFENINDDMGLWPTSDVRMKIKQDPHQSGA